MSGRNGLPIVAIALRPDLASSPRRLYQKRVYFDAIEAAGGAVMPIPLTADEDRTHALYERCDAVCLAGGFDVAPERYGEHAQEGFGVESAPELDAVELSLTRWAVGDGVPVLGICRGAQVLNVALGGTLWQDIAGQVDGALQHNAAEHTVLVHPVELAPGSRLRDIVGARTIEVNSVHHQAIRDVAPSLRVTAHAPDGIVEAVELPDHLFAIGVQSHPEELTAQHPWASRLFEEFIAGARA
ncbi:MAG: gamma-glutamyl-gamma-aminobutyrate hydrolase family protein [Candidatus Dormibacteraeota bacterium]|nr:gamma-glutamyl-gamma-aminobutyrate hydrolase family protein [Candidatus Dormibacteraeota bacterium]